MSQQERVKADTKIAEDIAPVGETAPTTKARPRRRRRGQVTVFPNWCKGCGLCVALCPMKVLEQQEDGRVIIAYPEKCTACYWCELHCPDFAIFVSEVEGE